MGPATPKVTGKAYLARVATARPLYALMFREAIGVLPPAQDTTKLEPIACGLSLAELGKRLDLSRSVVSEEMRRLVAHGWVTSAKPRLLGHRKGLEPKLLADVAAEEVTGERGLVSRFVLHLDDQVTEDTDIAQGGRARRWRRR